MANPGMKAITANVTVKTMAKIKERISALGTNQSQYLRDLVQQDIEPEPKTLPKQGFIKIGDMHSVKYEELSNVATMLNSMINKVCACQFCSEPMELVDMRRRWDYFSDAEQTTYENLELYYECGNGSCSTGIRTMIECGNGFNV